jgi:hypothetical protein
MNEIKEKRAMQLNLKIQMDMSSAYVADAQRPLADTSQLLADAPCHIH